MSLLYIGQEMMIFGGLFLVISGLVGNSINVLVFSNVRTYRQTPCSFYFLIASIFNIGYVLINLISRVLSSGFEIDPSRTSIIWCKIRSFCLYTFVLIILSCSCLSTIDQYFVSSQNIKLRRLSHIKYAHGIIMLMILLWCIHEIPIVLFFNISPLSRTCVNSNTNYKIYIPIYYLGLLCVIPILIMVTFAYLTYRNIHMTRIVILQHIDRQLVKMTLSQVALDLICFVPIGSYNAYILITSNIVKDTNRLANENFALNILGLFSYVYYTGGCCIFFISSSRFRRATKQRILFCFRLNQIFPFQIHK